MSEKMVTSYKIESPNLKNAPMKTVTFEGKDRPVRCNPLDFDAGRSNIALVEGLAADSHNSGGRPAVKKMAGDGQVREI